MLSSREPPMADPRRGFATPPEVLDYFRQKGLRPAFSWQDVWGEEHAYAFMVAKAVELELLATFKDSIEQALANGQTFETWRAGLLPRLAAIGWDVPRTVADPTGQEPPREVDFTAPRRLKTIFQANMASARSAGQWNRAQRTKAGLPYILYVRTTSADPRVEHLTWVGLILPVDHLWWHTHWPPNGWGCKCTVRQITGRERDRLLLNASKGADGIWYTTEIPDNGPPRTFVNRRTGQVTEVPAGIDPGWGGNPGRDRAMTLTTRLTEQLEAAGEQDARDAIAAIGASDMPRVLSGLPEDVPVPVAVTPPAVAAQLGSGAVRIVESSNRDLGPRGELYPQIQPAIDAGELVPGSATGSASLIARVGGFVRRVVLQAVDGGRRVLLKRFSGL